MLKKIEIKSPGDSNFVTWEIIEKTTFDEDKFKIKRRGKKSLIIGERILMGITKASHYKQSHLFLLHHFKKLLEY